MRELLIEKYKKHDYIKTTDLFITKVWEKDGKLNNPFPWQPAMQNNCGGKRYYSNGKIHRDGYKPAIIEPNGSLHFYKNGACYLTLIKSVFGGKYTVVKFIKKD